MNIIAVDSESVTGLRTSSVALSQEVSDYLDNIKKMADGSGIECEIVIEESFYRPEKTIVNLAYKHNADVLVMGRHGKKGLLKLLVGSMTSKVIAQGFPQVLVVPHEYSIKGERILVATDGSEAGESAAETAINMGKNCSGLREIHVLSVASSEDELEQATVLTEAVCAQGREQAPSANFHPLAIVGKPAADVIAKTAEEKEVDMILVGRTWQRVV